MRREPCFFWCVLLTILPGIQETINVFTLSFTSRLFKVEQQTKNKTCNLHR